MGTNQLISILKNQIKILKHLASEWINILSILAILGVTLERAAGMLTENQIVRVLG